MSVVGRFEELVLDINKMTSQRPPVQPTRKAEMQWNANADVLCILPFGPDAMLWTNVYTPKALYIECKTEAGSEGRS